MEKISIRNQNAKIFQMNLKGANLPFVGKRFEPKPIKLTDEQKAALDKQMQDAIKRKLAEHGR